MATLDPKQLFALAHSQSEEDRRFLFSEISQIARVGAGLRSVQEDQLLSDILTSLAAAIDAGDLKLLVEPLAGAMWPPKQAILWLALRDIDISAPILARSPLLTDDDLVHILRVSSVEHQMEVARRPDIGPTVCEIIVNLDESQVLIALASNASARIGEQEMGRLVALSKTLSALRSPLARHPRLTQPLAVKLYLVASESLRNELVARFSSSRTKFELASLKVRDRDIEHDQDAEDRAMLKKLQSAGKLGAMMAIRALRDGKLNLFQNAMAMLTKLDVAHIRAICNGRDTAPLALACVAVGIDRAAFPSILSDVRQLNKGRPMEGADQALRTATAFHQTPGEAHHALLHTAHQL